MQPSTSALAANGTIDALVIQPADQLVGHRRRLTQYADQPCAHIARIYGGGVTGSGALQFNASDYYIDENGGQALITVIRTGAPAGRIRTGRETSWGISPRPMARPWPVQIIRASPTTP